MSKLYSERDVENLSTYCNHVLAMTKEGLHSKSDIAAELAFRDEQVKLLREALVRISEFDNMSQEFRLDNGSRGQQRVIVDIAEKALEATK